ncbi:MAG: arginase family protein [Trueperaceae bacterium]
MGFRVIVSQGRLADRTPGAVAGAALLGAALAERLGVSPRFVGVPAAPKLDRHEGALAEAEPTLLAVAEEVRAAFAAGSLPLIAGNKCPVALASLPVAAAAHTDLCVVWFDAHGDFHTPHTSDSGYLGGMVLAAACGLWSSGHGAGVNPRNVVLVGARDLDAAEAEFLALHGVTVLHPASVTEEALRRAVAGRPLWVHVDLDVLEPGFVPLDYEVPGGFSPVELRALLAVLPAGRLVGAEVTEFEAPVPGADAVAQRRSGPERSAEAAAEAGTSTATSAAVASVLHALGPLLGDPA